MNEEYKSENIKSIIVICIGVVLLAVITTLKAIGVHTLNASINMNKIIILLVGINLVNIVALFAISSATASESKNLVSVMSYLFSAKVIFNLFSFIIQNNMIEIKNSKYIGSVIWYAVLILIIYLLDDTRVNNNFFSRFKTPLKCMITYFFISTVGSLIVGTIANSI